MHSELFSQFDPDADALLRKISARVDDAMLKKIAAADYGEEADEHFAALKKIRDSGEFPTPQPWCPGEVLELIRWSEPEDPAWKPGETGETGHWMRAFCCAALLRAAAEPWNWNNDSWVGVDSTAVQLAISLWALEPDFSMDAIHFFSWLLLHSDTSQRYEYASSYGLVLIGFALNYPNRFSDNTMIELAQWVLDRAVDFNPHLTSRLQNIPFQTMHRSQKRASWLSLADKLAAIDLSTRSEELRIRIRSIYESLSAK